MRPASCRTGGQRWCEAEDASYPVDLVRKAITTNSEITPTLFTQLFDSPCHDPVQTRSFNIDEEQLCHGIPKSVKLGFCNIMVLMIMLCRFQLCNLNLPAG